LVSEHLSFFSLGWTISCMPKANEVAQQDTWSSCRSNHRSGTSQDESDHPRGCSWRVIPWGASSRNQGPLHPNHEPSHSRVPTDGSAVSMPVSQVLPAVSETLGSCRLLVGHFMSRPSRVLLERPVHQAPGLCPQKPMLVVRPADSHWRFEERTDAGRPGHGLRTSNC
jgi:hypothetical protein